jgi:GNAT superfamily N-acetyltransferase
MSSRWIVKLTPNRAADPRDLIRLEDIENKADALFLERIHPKAWRPTPTAKERLASAGYILVVAEGFNSEAVGFVHVVLTNDVAHLEQLSVLRSHGRRGHGRASVEAAKREVLLRGFSEITLRTFAEIPWNAPFYSDCGFIETEPATAFYTDLLHAEIEAAARATDDEFKWFARCHAAKPHRVRISC